MSLIDKIPIEDMLKLRKMPRAEGLKFLERFNLGEEDLATAQSLFQDDEPEADTRYDNRKWVVAAYLLGATYRQIAVDKGVSRQSVFDMVDRVLPQKAQRKRLNQEISLEAMGEYKVAYFDHIDSLRHKSPEEIALWLYATVELDR